MLFPDFTVEKGEPCLLLGDSGSGKTTLLHLIGGLLRPGRGEVIINGTRINSFSGAALDHFRGQQMGFIFQKNHLIGALSVKQNLLMAPFLAGLRPDARRAEELLSRLGLDPKANADVRELSQGQAQRVAIARAVLNRPAVILADEPTSALDDGTCEMVIAMLLEIAAENGSTLLVATHDQRLRSRISRQVIL